MMKHTDVRHFGVVFPSPLTFQMIVCATFFRKAGRLEIIHPSGSRPILIFGPRVYPLGSIVIALVRLSVRL